MSGVVVLGKDSNNNVLKEVGVTPAGLLKCDVDGVALASNQATGNASLASIATNTTGLNGCVSGTELQVDIVSSALPSGGATASNQATINTSIGTGNASLATIATNTTLGNANKANSLSVTIASDEGAIAVSAPALTTTSSTIINNATVADGATEVSSAIDMRTAKCLTIYGATTDTDANLSIMLGGTSGGTYYEANSVFLQADFTSGDFGIMLGDVGASYVKLHYKNTSGSSKTISAFAEIKN